MNVGSYLIDKERSFHGEGKAGKEEYAEECGKEE